MTSQQEQVLFEALVRQTADTLHLYLRTCTRDAALAEEVFQDALVVAWQRLADYDSKRPFGAWVRGIASNILKAKRRERASSPCVGDELLEQLAVRFGALEREPGDTLDEKLESLRTCIGELSDRDRHAIEGRYEHGLRGASLADRLQTSLENARKTVQRARARIMDCMKTRIAFE